MNQKTQTVMVTGACGNLGRALAALFSKSGGTLVLVDRYRARLQRIYGSEHAHQMFAQADLLVQDEVTAAVKAANAQFGAIDVLCNIAGGFRMGSPVHETSDETWSFLLDLNVMTMLNTVRAVVPRMLAQGGGRVVNVAANAALRGTAGMGA